METTTNEAAVIYLKKLGFELPNIRRALLKLSSITEPELADKCNLTRTTIAAYINGNRSRLKTQSKIAKNLGVRPDILFDEWADAVSAAGVYKQTGTCGSQVAA